MAIWQQEIWEAVALHYFGLTIVCLMGGKEPREYSSRADHFLDSLDHFMPGCGLKMIGPNCHLSLGRYFQFFVDSYYATMPNLCAWMAVQEATVQKLASCEAHGSFGTSRWCATWLRDGLGRICTRAA